MYQSRNSKLTAGKSCLTLTQSFYPTRHGSPESDQLLGYNVGELDLPLFFFGPTITHNNVSSALFYGYFVSSLAVWGASLSLYGGSFATLFSGIHSAHSEASTQPIPRHIHVLFVSQSSSKDFRFHF